MERKGYSVHAFESPTKALDHMKAGCGECSMVLTDIRMPGMTGIELVVHLKKLRSEMRVVLMTAFSIERDDLQKIIPNTRIDGFVSKPFQSAELIRVLREAEAQKKTN